MTARSKIVGLTRQAESGIDVDPSEGFSDFGSVDEAPEHISASHDAEVNAHNEFAIEYPNETTWKSYLFPASIILLSLAWTGFFGLAFYPEMRDGLPIDRIAALTSIWAAPVLLLAVLWLLALRHSHSEATRFGNVAYLLRRESEALEIRMRTVNEEISIAREFLAQNARELETVGKNSSKNMIEASRILSEALADSDMKAKTLEAVSNAASTNMDQLRKHLPVVTSAAKDVTNQIGSAGNNAQIQIKSLIAGLERIGEVGISTKGYIDKVGESADVTSQKLEKISSASAELMGNACLVAEERSAIVAQQIKEAAQYLTAQVNVAVSDVDKIVSESRTRVDENAHLVRQCLDSISQQSSDEQNRMLNIIGEIENHINLNAERIAQIDKTATDQTAKLAFAVSALNSSTTELGTELTNNHIKTEQLMHKSDELLAGLQVINNEIINSIPNSIENVDIQIARTSKKIDGTSENVIQLNAITDDLLRKTDSLGELISSQSKNIEMIISESDKHFTARHDQIDALSRALSETRVMVEAVSEDVNGKLITGLLGLGELTRKAADESRKIVDEELALNADKLTEQNRLALSEAIDRQISSMNELIQSSINRNLTLSENSTLKLTSQLKQLDELADNLEKRIEDSRNSFDGIDDDSFARRMVLLTESLNSTSIDVAKILSNEVTDTAWASYLKGDRGVFTRRAVRLLDAGESRAIASHYGQDAEFREHVNRYIHDFEAMMRVLLSTRDGNAICVTLLSSDVGKLYVALAQAIERLRN